MNDKKPTEEKSKETKQQSTRKKIIKVKKLKNTNDMTGAVGGQGGGGVNLEKAMTRAASCATVQQAFPQVWRD